MGRSRLFQEIEKSTSPEFFMVKNLSWLSNLFLPLQCAAHEEEEIS